MLNRPKSDFFASDSEANHGWVEGGLLDALKQASAPPPGSLFRPQCNVACRACERNRAGQSKAARLVPGVQE